MYFQFPGKSARYGYEVQTLSVNSSLGSAIASRRGPAPVSTVHYRAVPRVAESGKLCRAPSNTPHEMLARTEYKGSQCTNALQTYFAYVDP